MPSTFLGLNTAYRGLVAANSGLNTTANNISNIETTGYSRQVVNQEASKAIQTYQSYGCVGTGVDTLASERVRDEFYDTKYRNNAAKLGEYDKKQYYASLVENYLQDTQGSNAVIGFTTLFDEMDAAMQSLSTHTGDSSYALAFIGTAGNLCEYFRLLYNNFQTMQTDINDEIKITVDDINGISQQIASLNKEINVIESDGTSIANELRDKRDVLVDELSSLIDTEITETDILSTSGEKTGLTNYVVKIAGGQTLVEGYDYRTLSCVPRDDKHKTNQNDVDGLYDIYWDDTGEEIGIWGGNVSGELKGLFEMRDGNNNESFNGTVTDIDEANQTVTVSVSADYLTDMSKSTLPLGYGVVTVNCEDYVYDSWDYATDADGNVTYTFHLSTTLNDEPIEAKPADATYLARVGESVDYQGIAYYLEQMNEWVRLYAQAYNNIYGQDGATDYYEDNDRTGAIFFTGNNDVTSEQYSLDVALTATTFSSSDDGYFKLTAGNFEVIDEVVEDPNKTVTHTGTTTGISSYDIVDQLKDLASDTDLMSFRGAASRDFLVSLMSDAALNAASANSFQTIYEKIESTIETNRTSISGVDADEEAANLLVYQTAYSLSSKMISVLAEVYDRLILETGV